MALVLLRAPLSELAGGREHRRSRAHRAGGARRRSSSACPPVSGWVLDERRAIRPHVNVYVNGQLAREETAGRRAPTASTSCRRSREDEMTELLVGTKKGLFVLDGDVDARLRGDRARVRRASRSSTRCATRAPAATSRRSRRGSTAAGSGSTDDPAGEWQEAEGTALPEDGDASLARIWVIAPGEADGVLYAGGDPGCLFESRRRRPHVGAQPRALGPPDASGLDTRAAVGSACTRSSPGPATPTG